MTHFLVTPLGRTRFTPNGSHVGAKKGNGPTLKVIHISDTHMDESYVEGAKADCEQPLCCRRENGMAREGEQAAGKDVSIICHFLSFVMCQR